MVPQNPGLKSRGYGKTHTFRLMCILINPLQSINLYSFHHLKMTQETNKGFVRNPVAGPLKPLGKNYLFVIGIDQYQHIRKLNNAVRDAKTIHDLLLTRYQFSSKEDTTICLFDQDATRENILEQLEAFESLITKDDNLLIYFSGHGTMNERKTKGYWIPVEAQQKRSQYISNSDIRDRLEEINAHHIYLIIDSCFSGSFVHRSEEFTKRVYKFPSRRVLTSGRNEVVSDGRRGSHSPFASCVITFLEKQQGSLSSSQLEQYVKENTPRNAHQVPDAASIHGVGDKGGEFVFHPKVDEKKDWAQAEQENSIASYQKYVKRHPEGSHAQTAHQRIQKLEESRAWEMAMKRNTTSGYRSFMKRFPQSEFADRAFEALETAEEKLAWKDTQRRDRISVYLKFIRSYPNSLYRTEAERRIEELDELLNAEPIVKETPSPHSKTQTPTPESHVVESQPKKIVVAGFEMIRVEGGTFQLGGKGPEITLSSFEIGKYPVTQAQWEMITQKGKTLKWGGKKRGNPSRFKKCENCPVESVSWYDVQEFIQKLNQQTGKAFFLPSEAQWEFAAKGGNESKGFEYAGSNEIEEVAWYEGNANNKTHPVGQKKPNELGLYDMSGNVWEWCQDWYGEYPTKPLKDPIGPNLGDYRVLRGGSWFYTASPCRLASRRSWHPGDRYRDIGFRLARLVER